MNVTFHTISSIAIASVFAIKRDENFLNWKKLLTVFVLGILSHGLLDFLPHQYPINSKIDVGLALFLFILTLFLVEKTNYVLLVFAFIGGIFPDLIDLSAGIANKHLGIPLPIISFKIFPWHWKEFSGSIYDGNRNIESAIYHILIVSFSLILVVKNRFSFFRSYAN